MKETKISRRDFLKGTVAGAAAFALTATGTPVFAEEAEKNKNENPTADATAPIPPVEAPEQWDKTADIVIVGTGGGGVTAAQRLSEGGNRVILIEREGVFGGMSRYGVFWFNNGGTEIAEQLQWAFPDYPYDPHKIVEYYNDQYKMTGNTKLLAKLAETGPRVIEWAEKEMGAAFMPSPLHGALPSAAHLLFFNTSAKPEAAESGTGVGYDWLMGQILKSAQDHGTELLTSTEVTALVMSEGRVSGVKVRDKEGQEAFIKGEKAVLLTAGGFGNNRHMLKKYCPSVADAMVAHGGWSGGTGDCIRMGIGAGADIAGRDSVHCYDRGVLPRDYSDEDVQFDSWFEHDSLVGGQPWLLLNRCGERVPYFNIMHTNYPYSNQGYYMNGLADRVNPLAVQPGGKTFAIFDSKYREVLSTDAFGVRPAPGYVFDDFFRPVAVEDLADQLEKRRVESGSIKKADTIEELEEQLGFAPGLLVEAVQKWNAACEAGEDSEKFYPYEPQWLIPLDSPPYYGATVGITSYDTCCGLRVNADMQVISTEGKPIPGLYAGFHTAGGESGESVLNGLPFGSMYGSNLLSYVGGWMAADGISANES